MTEVKDLVTGALQPVAWIRKNGIRFNAEAEPQDDSETALYSQTAIDTLRDENKRLRTVLKATQEACDPQINADEMMQMAVDNTMLRLQLAEAQKDSERLDWLDRQTYAGANPRGNVWMIGWKDHAISGIDFRSAIDAAKETL